MKKWILFFTGFFLVSLFCLGSLTLGKGSLGQKQQHEMAKSTLLKMKKSALGSTETAVILDVSPESLTGLTTRSRSITVGRTKEVEPNNDFAQANRVMMTGSGGEKAFEPSAGGVTGDFKTFEVAGTFSFSDDTDVFCVACQPGEFMTFDVASFQEGAPTDIVMTVMDASGNIVATRDDGRGLSGVSLDPCLNVACPTGGGQFYVVLKNRSWMGSSIDPAHGDFSYVLSVGLDTRGEAEPNDYFAGDPLIPCCGHVNPGTASPDENDEVDEEGDGEGTADPCLFDGASTDEDEDEDGDTVGIVHGTINPNGDIDCYVLCLDVGDVARIDIDAGECNSFGTVTDANRNILFSDGSVFDPWVELISPSGMRVAESDDVEDVDPALLYTATERGPYVICVHSLWDNGHPDYVYRLSCRLLYHNEVESNDTPETAQDINCAGAVVDEDEDEEPDTAGGCDAGKPQVLVWEYTAQDCSFSRNMQATGKWYCEDKGVLQAAVHIVARSAALSGNPGGAKTWFDGTVLLGQTFAMDARIAGETRLGTQTYVYIYDLAVPPNLLQTLSIHTSCSQPLVPGDQFGSLILRTFFPDVN